MNEEMISGSRDNTLWIKAEGGLRLYQSSIPNFFLRFDDMGYENPFYVEFQFTVKKTILARLKYWLFCKFFPFKIIRWE